MSNAKRVTIVLALLGSACGHDSHGVSLTDPGTDGQEPPAMSGMTAAHNEARASVTPAPATPMQDLTWSSTIATAAIAAAENCVFEASGGTYGENLFAEYGSTSKPSAVVKNWMSEAAHYDYASNTCASGQICFDYTQVVWANSANFGCGRATCHANSPFANGGAWTLWVCNYDPAGNVTGQKPY